MQKQEKTFDDEYKRCVLYYNDTKHALLENIGEWVAGSILYYHKLDEFRKACVLISAAEKNIKKRESKQDICKIDELFDSKNLCNHLNCIKKERRKFTSLVTFICHITAMDSYLDSIKTAKMTIGNASIGIEKIEKEMFK